MGGQYSPTLASVFLFSSLVVVSASFLKQPLRSCRTVHIRKSGSQASVSFVTSVVTLRVLMCSKRGHGIFPVPLHNHVSEVLLKPVKGLLSQLCPDTKESLLAWPLVVNWPIFFLLIEIMAISKTPDQPVSQASQVAARFLHSSTSTKEVWVGKTRQRCSLSLSPHPLGNGSST